MTTQGYKELHAHLFGEIYEWAGQPRTQNIFKQGSSFTLASAVGVELDLLFQNLRQNRQLRDLAADRFAAKAAEHIGALNAVHAFREGNGRTMRIHLDQLSRQAGHQVDVASIPAAAWNAASIQAHRGDASVLTRLIQSAMQPVERLTVDEAIGRLISLREPALGEMRERTRQIAELLQSPQSSGLLSKELLSIKGETNALSSPDVIRDTVETLQQLKGRGLRELAVLTGEDASARDQIHAIGKAMTRAFLALDREPNSRTPVSFGAHEAPVGTAARSVPGIFSARPEAVSSSTDHSVQPRGGVQPLRAPVPISAEARAALASPPADEPEDGEFLRPFPSPSLPRGHHSVAPAPPAPSPASLETQGGASAAALATLMRGFRPASTVVHAEQPMLDLTARLEAFEKRLRQATVRVPADQQTAASTEHVSTRPSASPGL